MQRAYKTARYLRDLGTPPGASNPWGMALQHYRNSTDWTMMGNDSVGDCTCADCGHELMLWSGLGAGPLVIPTTADILAIYSAITGYDPSNPNSDTGADLAQVSKFIQDTGLLGHKLSTYGVLDPTHIQAVQWATQLFGTCKLGIQVPDFAMDQFNNNQPWDYTGQPYQILGGHDVPIVQYEQTVKGPLFWVVTWGKMQAMTPAFYNQFADEVVAPVSADFCYYTGITPSGLNLQEMIADLNSLS